MEENKLNLSENRPIILLDPIEKDLEHIYDHFKAIINRNKYLSKENSRLKEEAYKDEELSKMKEKYDKMETDYYRGFPISEEEYEKIKKWKKSLPTPNSLAGPIGGRFTYEFTPTSIGVIGTIIDTFSGEKFKFQDICYDNS